MVAVVAGMLLTSCSSGGGASAFDRCRVTLDRATEFIMGVGSHPRRAPNRAIEDQASVDATWVFTYGLPEAVYPTFVDLASRRVCRRSGNVIRPGVTVSPN